MFVRLLRFCLLAALCCTALPARAEPRKVDLAREAYVEGLEAARNVRWSDAVEHFRHSYELSHTTAALYNLGVALRALGRHREARDTFTVLLNESPDLDDVTRTNAEKLRADANERVVQVTLGGFDPEGAYEVVVDGVPSAVSGTTSFAVEVDEGRHAFSVQRGPRTLLRWTGAVRAGAPVSLDIERDEPSPPAEVARVPEVESTPFTRERPPQEVPAPRSRKAWWWAGGGAAVAAAALGVLIYSLRRPEPRTVDVPADTAVVRLP